MQQRNHGLVPGQTTTFDDISVVFDLDRDVPCPIMGKFKFCIKIDKGAARDPDFSIDSTSETEECTEIPCKGKPKILLHEGWTLLPFPTYTILY